MKDSKEVVNEIHNACEWGAFDKADAVLSDYTNEVKRLAKIEALDEVCKEIDSLELPRRAINAVTRMRDELKACL